MFGEHDLTVEQSGLPLFWVRLAGGRRLAWLRFGPLLFFLPLLVFFNSFFGPGHDPGGPSDGLLLACLAVIGIRGMMALVELVYRLPSRGRRVMLSHLISLGVTCGLALVVCLAALLLDVVFSPSGHFFAVQGFFAVLLTFWAAPVVFSILAAEPPGFYWQQWRAHEGRWSEVVGPLRGVVDAHPNTLRPALLLLEALLEEGERVEPIRLLKQITARHPRAWAGWAALGTLAMEEEQWEKALSALRKAYRLAPRAAQGGILLNQGLALLGAGDLESGYTNIEQAGKRLLPPHMRHFRRFMLMRLCEVLRDPGGLLSISNEAKRHPKDCFAFLEWYETLDRSRSTTLGEDLYEANEWSRRLVGILQRR